jgi:hypothetical protein
MSHFIKTTLLACLAAASLSAHADNVKFSGYANGNESVNISLSAPNQSLSTSVDAGGFLTSLNNGASFATFCVDLYQTISFGGAGYNDYSVVAGSAYSFANSHAASDLGKLFSEGHVLNSAKTEAAFQIAVWEIVYETSGSYNLASGTAKFTGGTANFDGSLALATSWLGSLANTPSLFTVEVLKSATHQDQVFAQAVPEPSTYALLAGGLFAIGFVARRRKAG